jgi:hypothetical protein
VRIGQNLQTSAGYCEHGKKEGTQAEILLSGMFTRKREK